MARSYKRDSNGRFAGGSGGKGGTRKASTAMPKTTTAKGRARTAETRARAAVRAGGGTKAARSLATAQRARDFYKATGTGTKRSKTKPRSGIRSTGGLPRSTPSNGIRPLSVSSKRNPELARSKQRLKEHTARLMRIASNYNRAKTAAPTKKTARSIATAQRAFAHLKAGKSTIRPYKPATPSGQMQQMGRRVSRAGRAMSDAMGSVRRVRASAEAMKQRFARRTARDIANSTGTGITADVARMSVRVAPPQEIRAARGIIARRAQRAAVAAARGSKPAAKAAAIYDRQLAPVLPKGKGKAKNNLKPGPRNTKGTPKKKRKPRKKR